MLKIEITGSAIGGEDAKEALWVDEIVSASDLANVSLTFRLEPYRNVDLDNLVRPAMRALKKSGFYQSGFPELNSITASKLVGQPIGVTIESGIQLIPEGKLLSVESDHIPPSDPTFAWKSEWTAAIQKEWDVPVISKPIWLAISTTSVRSLVDLMKPIIDGLEPVLGRDPDGRNRFCPNDHLVNWLQIRRVSSGAAVKLVAGMLS
ncbi:hypothetical protein M4951_06065 [Blastopirellula sp. J2-11]|uniref:hypothetical protein n=1 Tax=Blastopirellula sp. J2-11 TaxID=2943192 RepID=UPI0021C759E3|nr:hypothetical protein [Blastopirellula sp. J2-11]UUO07876.1 hypothetical protein M4951_06065 [Blastopirellula sp. J2-11]